MAYRKPSINSQDIINAISPIDPKFLELGISQVEISGVELVRDLIFFEFKDLKTRAVCREGSFLFNSILAATTYKDRDLMWEVKNEGNLSSLVGLSIRVETEISDGYCVVNKDKFHVVEARTGVIESSYDNAVEALTKLKSLKKAWINIAKAMPAINRKDIITNDYEDIFS